MTGQAGNSNTTTSLTGNAYIKTESMEIQADEVGLKTQNEYQLLSKQIPDPASMKLTEIQQLSYLP